MSTEISLFEQNKKASVGEALVNGIQCNEYCDSCSGVYIYMWLSGYIGIAGRDLLSMKSDIIAITLNTVVYYS